MINGQKEIWIKIDTKARTSKRIIALSNCGRAMRANGEIFVTKYNTSIWLNNKHNSVYRILAGLFLHKTEDDLLLQRNEIDHKSHSPNGMFINDVRNLRWCTHKENLNFSEAIKNNSEHSRGFKTEFGKAFYEKHGFGCENPELYNKLYNRYYRYGELP